MSYIVGTIVVLAVLVGGGVWMVSRGGTNDDGAYALDMRPLQRLVTFSGTVEPKQRVDLAFEKTGRITEVRVDTGSAVRRGDVIAVLAASDVDASLARERANLAAEEAQLDALKRGTRPEEIAVQRAELARAQTASVHAREALITALGSAYAAADTVVYKTIDQVFDNPQTFPRLKYHSRNSALDVTIESQRSTIESVMTTWRANTQTLYQSAGRDASTIATASQRTAFRTPALMARQFAAAAAATSAYTDKNPADSVEEARAHLRDITGYLDSLITYTDALIPGGNLSEATITSWETSVTAARTTMLTEMAALNTAYTAFTDAREAILTTQAQLTLSEAGATVEDIRAQEAAVAAQRARVAELESEREKYVLRAPFAGTVINRMVDPGELASASAPAVTLDSTDAFEVESRVSELDVVALRAGQAASVTLDAYGSLPIFDAAIATVDPSETTKDGVTGYGVTLRFNEAYAELKPGMTANVLVTVTERPSALATPTGYIKRVDDGAFVRVRTETGVEERAVRTGVSVPGGLVELVSGVQPGDVLLPY